jgi:hypothetical protein
VLISATNQSDLIEIRRFSSGAILVDDSQPWCWSREHATSRFEEKRDLLCLEGGLLDGSALGTETNISSMGFSPDPCQSHRNTLWSCVGEGLLLLQDRQLPPTLGQVKLESMLTYQESMQASGIVPAPLQCGGYLYSTADLLDFRKQYTRSRQSIGDS